MKKELTDAVVKAYKGGEVYEAGKHKGEPKPYPVLWDTVEPGLGVRYSMKEGTKTFIYQRRVKGTTTERCIKIGRYGERFIDKKGEVFCLDVKRARAKATAYRLMMTEDFTDPVAERQRKEAEKRRREQAEREAAALKKAQETTLREVLEDFLAKHKTAGKRPLRPATVTDYRHHVEKNLTDWADRPVTTITRAMCVEKFVEVSKRAPGQANSLLVYLRSLLNHGRLMHEDEDGNSPILMTNAAARAIKYVGLNEEKPRTGRIPLDRIGHVWNALRERAENPRTRTVADWLTLVLLTGARKTESASLTWSNVDFEKGTIRFPPEVTKNHCELVLPMSDPMRDMLEARQPAKLAGYVFPSRTSKTYVNDPRDTLAVVSTVAGCEVTLHDFRRTQDSIAQECKIDSDVRRKLLNHKTGDVHSRHYANADGKALQAPVTAIAAWVTQQAKVAASANVVPLPTAAQRKAAG